MTTKKNSTEQTKSILRVNKHNPTHAHPPPENPDRASFAVRRSGPYVPRKRGKNEATPPANDLFSRALYDGAELRPYEGRSGSMDAFKLKSIGFQTERGE